MYKNIVDARLMAKIGEYGIVRVKEELRFNAGSVAKREVWYDVCLDQGEGDIVTSFNNIKAAKQWAKENM